MKFLTISILLLLIYLNYKTCAKTRIYPKQELNKAVSIKIHETTMYNEEVDKCKTIVTKTLDKKLSTKKAATVLRKELDRNFQYEQFKFSVLVVSNVTQILGKKLYGIWVLLTANEKHFLLIASYPIVNGKKITEAQMDKIEDWTSMYFIEFENITNNSKFNKISEKLKGKLDANYGKGNAWAVIILKQHYTLRAKQLIDANTTIEFSRLNESHWLVFRGGEDVGLSKRFKQHNHNSF